jgi:hypothetical protein
MIVRPFPLHLSLAVVLPLTLGGCAEPVSPTDLNQLVVQAYLYAGQPVNDIYISTCFAIGSTDTSGLPVTNAAVQVLRDGTAFALVPDESRPGYYGYSGSDLSIRTGDRFSIDVQWGSQHATASTVVPDPPAGISVCQDTLRVRVESVFGQFQRVVSDDSCVVRWTGNDDDLFYVVMQNVDSNPVEILVSQGPGPFGLGMRSQPSPQTWYRIRTESLQQTGKHSVRVYRVNKEYADLYRSRQQDTRSLNEPLTNVQNGLGVFSAFASDSVAVVVILD